MINISGKNGTGKNYIESNERKEDHKMLSLPSRHDMAVAVINL